MNPTASEAFYAALLDDDPEQLYDRAPCGYLTTAPDGTVVKTNATFLSLTGYTQDDLVGRRTFADLLSAGGRIYHETHYDPLLRMQGTVREVALDIVRADGGRLPVLVNAVLERDPEGVPTLIRIAVFEATDRRDRTSARCSRARRGSGRRRPRAWRACHGPDASGEPHPACAAGRARRGGPRRPRPVRRATGSEVGGDFYDLFEASHAATGGSLSLGTCAARASTPRW